MYVVGRPRPVLGDDFAFFRFDRPCVHRFLRWQTPALLPIAAEIFCEHEDKPVALSTPRRMFYELRCELVLAHSFTSCRPARIRFRSNSGANEEPAAAARPAKRVLDRMDLWANDAFENIPRGIARIRPS